jgi:transcriptional regulator with XRE-family HTH domain
MSKMTRISGRLIAAGRALVGVSQADFATACGLDVDTLCRLEAGGSAWVNSDAEVEAVARGMNHFGVMIVEETDGMGAGVRLKFTRADVRQIARLESEGGVVGSDDAP